MHVASGVTPSQRATVVEGSEYAVLRRLLESGVLCRRVTDLFVEWHDVDKNLRMYRWLQAQLNGHTPSSRGNEKGASGHCRTRLHSWA